MKKTIVVHQENGIEPSPILPDIPLTRREFLAGSAILTGTLAIGTTLSTLAPSRVWAAEMSVLNEREAQIILKMTQIIFPHKNLPEAINALAVKDLDAAAEDAAVADSFRSGIVALDEAAGGDWLSASLSDQTAAIESIKEGDFFTTVRGQCITSLYDNELAYEHFGYEGEAFSKGGYLKRGFNDLSWLPEPPYHVSPTPR